MLVKICGISTPDTLTAAIEAGATHVGLVHFKPSPRHLSLKDAAELRAEVPDEVQAVLLMVNPDSDLVARAIEEVRPDVIQFHGRETPFEVGKVRETCGIEVWKALSIRDSDSLLNASAYAGSVDRLLFDAPPPADSALPGGNGEAFDWSLLKGHDHAVDWGLAGGLNPDNVAEAIHATDTPLVDASSGLESAPGIKDAEKIGRFCAAALAA